jgi:hypothetical protein
MKKYQMVLFIDLAANPIGEMSKRRSLVSPEHVVNAAR